MLRRVLVALALLASPMLYAQSIYVEGRDYQAIDPPQRPANPQVIEVTEVFGYSCIHCAAAAPAIDAWTKRQADDVAFTLLPAMFGGPWEAFGRAYYAAEAQGLVDKTHEALFRAIHTDKRPIRNLEDIADFYAEHGANRDAFLDTMTSFGVNAKVKQATQKIQAYGVQGTPSIVVNGRYLVMPRGEDPEFKQMLAIVDHLVEQERQRVSTPAAH